MYEFKYHRPTTVRQAANLLTKFSEAKLLAGGHSLIPVMKLRLAKPSDIVDLSQIEGLNTIELKGRSIVIGAMAKHGEVANSKVVQEAFREHHGLQCGFCTPGMVMTAVDMVHRLGNELDEHTIRLELDGNLCRCTGYHNIVKAIAAGAKAMKGSSPSA